MNKDRRIHSLTLMMILAVLLLPIGNVFAVFDSGSTGANGAFPPVTVPAGTDSIQLNLNSGVVTFSPGGETASLPNTPGGGFSDGILHFTTFDLPAGVTLTLSRNNLNTPIFILTTGDVNVDGSIDISGQGGAGIGQGGAGLGGPGGFRGGNSTLR